MIDIIKNELEKLNADRTASIQKIREFEIEMSNLTKHVNMIEGAIQTCNFLLTQDKVEDTEDKVEKKKE